LSTKVRELFNLSEGETVQSCHPCWLFRTILLRGYVYFTNSYLCFYAYLPSKGNRATRAGPLMKRTRRTMRFSKHWAVLRGNALSWYESNKDPYFPQGHIDLRTVQDVSSVAGDGKGKESQFTVETPERTFLFSAPSNDSRDVWVQAILKAVFRARNDGDSVRIGIPFETILDVEES
ncbi:PH domain-like protein, partial [Tilletiaria anomala UBC 951]